uniref:Uncharacterized protein n=1 Tax=Rhinolophus ferrumequinum TaxID=59479 RepID=A0A671E944_RHIFE
VSRVYAAVLGFHSQYISIRLFKVQCTTGCDVTSIWIEIEEEAGASRALEEGIGDLCINAFIPVCGLHLQHGGSPGHVFLESNSVRVLAEHGSVIVGISDLDPDMGGAT